MKTTLLQFITVLLIIFWPCLLKAQGPLNALKLDGIDDYVDLGTSNRGITNSVTVEAWVKTSSFKYHWILGKYSNSGDRGYHLIIKDGKAAFAGRDGSGNYRNSGYSNTLVNDNNWHHLAGVCNNGIWQIYVDGILEVQFNSGFSQTNLATTVPMAIGKDVIANNENYNGIVDEIKVWNKALTADEIRQNMCQKVSTASNGLVAYYKFDQTAGSTVQDESNSKINGTFRNMNPSTAWVVSGAPVGDKSVYRYASKWDNSLELITSIANFSVSRADAAVKGFHLYQVASTPTSTNGLPNPQEVKEYYGLFKIGEPDKKYKIWFKQYDLTCGGKLYRRNDNTVTSWAAVADTVNSPGMTYHSSANYGEFSATGIMSGAVTINGPAAICKGANATLSVTTDKGTVKWSTGATTKSIQIIQAGTYTVTVTENSCQLTGSITVQETTPVAIDLGPDKTLCFGESVMLAAPSGFAAYKWNTGATTSSITATVSGTYWVEGTSANGCVSRDEVKVTIPKEPALPWAQEYFVCYGKPVILNATVAGATYFWSNGATTPAIEVKQPGNFKVDIMLNGCTITRETVVSDEECPIIPNIITPNGDGKNDVFLIEGVATETLQIKIINRWGKSIYQSERYDNSWSASSVPAGLYFYHLKSSRSQNTFKGWLEVIK
ncbi:gliding motility-associated-like protein [Pontibacter aydingkolensis]|uniref:Gliding motility-associated C-terminal domain-containing protein n=1 Tax=Pontibacter aydingkolensis TaxID=1911536 RepID=A0ABS7CVK4_9BACT|nr:LamG-like jellyroll fold domain-containing protein [Pontibacter aydingkolensis]MBW7467883.1 gliding motility-associated C-terminal domain-containing protein [Pontibacter aydingkolensis]